MIVLERSPFDAGTQAPESRRRVLDLVRLGGQPDTRIAMGLGISDSCLRQLCRAARGGRAGLLEEHQDLDDFRP
jgi:hypothetical protein